MISAYLEKTYFWCILFISVFEIGSMKRYLSLHFGLWMMMTYLFQSMKMKVHIWWYMSSFDHPTMCSMECNYCHCHSSNKYRYTLFSSQRDCFVTIIVCLIRFWQTKLFLGNMTNSLKTICGMRLILPMKEGPCFSLLIEKLCLVWQIFWKK